MDNSNLSYKEIINWLHQFGLSDEEIQEKIDELKANREAGIYQPTGSDHDISEADVKPYTFKRVESLHELGQDTFDDQFEAWKASVEAEIDNNENNYPEKIDDETFEKFKVMRDFDRIIERSLIRVHNELEKNLDDEKAKQHLEYFKDLQSILQRKMLELAPADFIASLSWMEPGAREPKKYTVAESEDIIFHYNCAHLYEQKVQENSEQEKECKNLLATKMSDEEVEEATNKYTMLCRKGEFYESKMWEHLDEVPMDIDQFREIKEGTRPEEMSEKHMAYLAELSEQAKAIQEKQVELLVAYETGQTRVNPEYHVENLQSEFNQVTKRMTNMRALGIMLGIDEADREQEHEDDGIIRASGKDILALMDSKQRYQARQDIHEMKTGKTPGWLKRQALRLPSRNMDDIITEYIDAGALDIESIIGYSREEIGVKAESKRIAREILEERQRAAVRPKVQTTSQPNEDEKNENLDSSEISGDDVSEEHPESKNPEEHSEGENSSEEQHELSPEEIESIKAQILEKFNELSTESRVAIYAKLYGLDEKGKQVFALFDSLSPEGKEALYNKMYSHENREMDDKEEVK